MPVYWKISGEDQAPKSQPSVQGSHDERPYACDGRYRIRSAGEALPMSTAVLEQIKRTKGDNPTLGIVLCADTDEDIARYSVPHGSNQLFASKYMLYLPSEDELRREIETQKMFFALQQAERSEDEQD